MPSREVRQEVCTRVEGDGISLCTWAYATWIGVSPVCGLLPVSISNSTTPVE